LPTVNVGRIGLDYYRKDPNLVFAIIDSDNVGKGNDAFLGVQYEDQKGGGAKLTVVRENGPAARGGLKVDDVIQSADGKPVAGSNARHDVIFTKKPNDKVEAAILRGGEKKEVEITVAARSQQQQQQGGRGGPGGGPGGPGGGPPQFATIGLAGEMAAGGVQ